MSTVPGIPQVFYISFISFTGMKFKSHSPSVTPSLRVSVSSPVQVNLSVDAALAAAAAADKTSEQMQEIARCLNILAIQKSSGL